MSQDLVGYVLGALDAPEHNLLDQQIQDNPDLQATVAVLESRLRFWEDPADQYELPANLTRNTLAYIDAHRPSAAAAAVDDHPVGRPRSRWADWIGGVAVLAAAAAVFIPLLFTSIETARREVCQNNLRDLGTALTSFSENHDGSFPEIPQSGNRAVAGSIAGTLIQAGYLVNQQAVVCPSSELAKLPDRWNVPKLAELDQTQGERLVMLQKQIGGSLGYYLGYVSNDVYRTPRNQRRSTFALASDSPNCKKKLESLNHGGKGQNVLREDGVVEFIVGCRLPGSDDMLFTNRDGIVAAAHDENDNVIGPSETSPLTNLIRFRK